MTLLSRFVFVVATALLAALIAPVTSAHAAPGQFTITAPSPLALQGLCPVAVPISYSVELPPGAVSYAIDLKLVDPAGNILGSIGDAAEQTAPSGQETAKLCNPSLGTWQVRAVGRFYLADGRTQWVDEYLATTFESVAAMTSRLSLQAKRKGKGKRSRVVAKAGLEVSSDSVTYVPGGAGSAIEFQRRVKKGWRPVEAVVTDEAGLAQIKLRTPKKVVLRAVYAGYGASVGGSPLPVAAASSPTRKVRRR